MTILGVAVGGGIGALVRYQIGGLIASRQETPMPLATLVVNVAGSLLLGLLVGLVGKGGLSENWLIWGGVGFCGGLTTFSTFTYETLVLAEQGAWRYVWRNIALSGPVCCAAAAAGYWAGSLG